MLGSSSNLVGIWKILRWKNNNSSQQCASVKVQASVLKIYWQHAELFVCTMYVIYSITRHQPSSEIQSDLANRLFYNRITHSDMSVQVKLITDKSPILHTKWLLLLVFALSNRLRCPKRLGMQSKPIRWARFDCRTLSPASIQHQATIIECAIIMRGLHLGNCLIWQWIRHFQSSRNCHVLCKAVVLGLLCHEQWISGMKQQHISDREIAD